MLTKAFCTRLEYYLGSLLEASAEKELAGYWCDGILLPDANDMYAVKTVNDTRRIVLIVLAGKTGQERHELTLLFGDKAMSRYAKGLEIESCLPQPGDTDIFYVDAAAKKISIQLL